MVAPLKQRFRHSAPWDLFDELHREFGRFFGDVASAPGRPASGPALNLAGDADAVHLTMEVPGLEAKDLDIQLEGRVLTVSGQVHDSGEPAETSNWIVRQRAHGAFERVVELPYEIEEDGVGAKVENGLLRLELPRREATKPRRIEIKG